MMDYTCIFFGVLFTIAGFVFALRERTYSLICVEKYAAGRKREN